MHLFPDTEQYKCREEFHRHLPSAHRYDDDDHDDNYDDKEENDDDDDDENNDDDDGDDDDDGNGDDVDEHCQLVWNSTNFHFHSFINFDLFPHHM